VLVIFNLIKLSAGTGLPLQKSLP